ncbi:MAG: hypothetical protein IPL23_21475 [Saprospiraceae bacterium]|nr:hypothetical protein [Saprospiraceae bacterium]
MIENLEKSSAAPLIALKFDDCVVVLLKSAPLYSDFSSSTSMISGLGLVLGMVPVTF